MLKNIKTATKDSIIYGFGNLAVKIVGVVLIPVYTNSVYISFDDFGRFGIMEALSTLLAAVLGFSLTQGITRWYWDPAYKNRQNSMVYTTLFFLALVSVVFLLLSLPFTRAASNLLFSTPDYSRVVSYVIIASILQVFIYQLQTLMKLQQKPVLYTISNIVRLIFTLLLTIYLVVSRKKSIEGIYLAQIIGSLFFLLLTIKYIGKAIRIKFEKEILSDMIAYSAPLMLASISGILLSSQDRYILNHYADLNKVGIYSLAYRISNTIKLLVVSSVQMAVSPMLFQMMEDKNSLRFYSKYMTYFAFVVAGFTLLLNLFCYEFLKVFTSDKNYWQAAFVIPILSLSLFFDMLKDTSLIGLQIKKKTYVISGVMVFIALFNMGLSFLLIPKWNYYGAAYATLVSEILIFLITLYYAQKFYRIPYEYLKITMLLVIVGIFSIVAFLINDLSLTWRLIIKIILLIIFPLILKPLNFYEPIELERLWGAYKKWKNPKNWYKKPLSINTNLEDTVD